MIGGEGVRRRGGLIGGGEGVRGRGGVGGLGGEGVRLLGGVGVLGGGDGVRLRGGGDLLVLLLIVLVVDGNGDGSLSDDSSVQSDSPDSESIISKSVSVSKLIRPSGTLGSLSWTFAGIL